MPFENKKQLLIIVAAVVVGIVAVILTSNYVKNDVDRQTTILAERFAAKQQQTISELQQRSEQQMAALAQELENVKGQQAQAMQKQMAAMQAQEQRERLQTGQTRKASKPSLALMTPKGKRAVTVMIDSLQAVGGLLNAGDFVDVIAELNIPAEGLQKKTVTAMIFQDLQILAINTNLNEPGNYDQQQAVSALKITFAVDPQEAGLLAFANKNGSLQLALRSPHEQQHQMVKADTWKTLADYVFKDQGFDIQNPDNEGENKPADNRPSIQIFRGGKEL